MFLSIPSSLCFLAVNHGCRVLPPPEDPGVLLHDVGVGDVHVVAHVVVQKPAVDRNFATDTTVSNDSH